MANLSARKADYGKFDKLNIQILGIGAGNPFSQKTLADSLKLPYPLLIDFLGLKVIKSFGVLSQTREITTRRSFFLIDKEGVVRGKWLPDEAQVFPSEAILQAARAISGKS